MRRSRVCRCLIASSLTLSLCGVGAAQQPATSSFAPSPLDDGMIRSWGDTAMAGTMKAWEKAFRKYHPEIRFEDRLMGTATSMAGIITGTSDLSLMGRPVTVNEVIGFEWVFRVKPLGIQVMNGGLKGEGKSPALAVFVAQDIPVDKINMAQLASILGCPTNPKEPVTWAMAGAEGVWRNKPIHVFLYDDQTGTGQFLQQAVQGTKDCWNWEIVKEFKDKKRNNGSMYPASQQIIDALKHDPDGLAVSTLQYASPTIKAISLSTSGDAIGLTRDSVIAAKYPLGRGIYIYINRAKDKPVEPKVAEFLRFILSPEGQSLGQSQGDFLPLNPAVAAEQRKKLE